MKKPNILWIMTDQQKYNALSCLGSISNMTDNLDKLAAEGILFENAYTPSPICGPARACFENRVLSSSNWSYLQLGRV